VLCSSLAADDEPVVSSMPTSSAEYATRAETAMLEAGIPGIKYFDQGSRLTADIERPIKENISIAKQRLREWAGDSTKKESVMALTTHIAQLEEQLGVPISSLVVELVSEALTHAQEAVDAGQKGTASNVAAHAKQALEPAKRAEKAKPDPAEKAKPDPNIIEAETHLNQAIEQVTWGMRTSPQTMRRRPCAILRWLTKEPQ
jgi:hypothetical protein